MADSRTRPSLLDHLTVVARWLRLIVPALFGLVVLTVGMSIAVSVVPALIFNSVGEIVASLTEGGSVGRQVLIIGLLLVGGEILGLVNGVVSFVTTEGTTREVNAKVIRAVGRVPGLGYFEDPQLADDVQQASRAGVQSYGLFSMSVNWVGYIFGALGLSAVAFRLGWWAPALIWASWVPSMFVDWRSTDRDYQAYLDSITGGRRAAYQRKVALSPQEAKEARIFDMGRWLMERQARFWTESMQELWAAARRRMWHNVAVIAVRLPIVMAPFVAAFLSVRAGDLSLAEFAAGILALHALIESAGMVVRVPLTLHQSSLFLFDMFRLLDRIEREPRLHASGTITPPVSPEQGLRFEGVTFAYPGNSAPVLEGLDLEIGTRTSLALVGSNGAGKSTLVKLLCRFYDPQQGRILFDGVDIREFDLQEYRRRLAVVFQDYVKFPFSFADNVGFGCMDRRTDRHLIQQAVAAAGAQTVVQELPDGIDTTLVRPFGEVDVSEGQWQRIALARAMAGVLGRNASLLVLDEPTASLDVRVEHELYQRFAEMTRDRTTLLISHRFSTVRMADRIALLEHGRVVEEGNHQQLMSQDSEYSRLYQLQARRFQETGGLE